MYKFFLFMILSYFSSASEQDFSKAKSIMLNEKLLWSLLENKCQNQEIKNEIIKDELFFNSLKSYPKELVILALKNRSFDLCYSAFSVTAKFLMPEYKDFVEKQVYDVINRCTSQNLKKDLCLDFIRPEIYYDLTHLLGAFCNKKSLSLFYKVQCKYQYIVNKRCELFSSKKKMIEECPFYFSNKREVEGLKSSFIGNNCKNLQVRKTPKC